MKILSLFDGISCGRLALERAGVPVDQYFASEIDKHAITVSQNNFPDIIRLGDVNNWQNWDIDWRALDLIIAGSPCQGFSREGKKLNFTDPRSKLFWVFVDILNHIKKANPDVKFLLENVVMKKEWSELVSNVLGVPYVFIDSALVSAQVRNRLYWTNIPGAGADLFGMKYPIPPRDRKITLDSVLDKSVSAKYDFDESKFSKQIDKKFRPPYATGLTECRTEKGKVARRQAKIDTTPRTKDCKLYKVNTSHKANCLTAVKSQLAYVVWTGCKFRYLTPLECERLQTIPDYYTSGVSDIQRYKMLGNGWTVDVIAHILKSLK